MEQQQMPIKILKPYICTFKTIWSSKIDVRASLESVLVVVKRAEAYMTDHTTR